MAENKGGYEFTRLRGTAGAEDMPQMDPRLQKLVAFQQLGHTKPETSSTDAGEVAVAARVTDLAAWEELSEVRPGIVVGEEAADGTVMVTGRIPVARSEYVRTRPFVVSLKAARQLKQLLGATTEEIGARPEDLPTGARGRRGRGVVVGIVDGGGDFAHQNFRTASGRTRLLSLWDQHARGSGEGSFDYGLVHRPAALDAALKKADPYGALGYDPGTSAHGTHVMDIAAGNGRGTGVAGVAALANLLFVDVASSDIPWTGPRAVGRTFGDSVHLLEALAFVFETAGDRPCAINVSLGTNGGPHDGSTLVEQGIDRLLTQRPNRAVVIAASNSFNDGIHAAGVVPATGTHDLVWSVAAGDWTSNELEVWYDGADRLSVELVAPDGSSVGTLEPGESATVSRQRQVVLFAANRLKDPNNGDNMVGVFLHPDVPPGQWTLRFRTRSRRRRVAYHAWIERDDKGQSSFTEPLDNSHTLGSISCGQKTIVVGSYDAHKASLPLSFFSSSGPTRDGRQKPEVSAPGHNVMAAGSRSGDGTVRKSGTSMAAPAVTGSIAVLLGEAKARGKSLTVDQIRDLVTKTARGAPPTPAGWDPRYGHGRISATGLVTEQNP